MTLSLFGDSPVKSTGKAGGLRAPFPYFGGKSAIADLIWYALGEPKQYIEPFAGSLAVLLANPRPASLEVVGDLNGYIANFWRAVKFPPDRTWAESDYPVSHFDLGARHRWLTDPARVADLAAKLADPEWPGDPRIAGWWAWGQCCWIGSGWCEPRGEGPSGAGADVPHVSDAGMGLQAPGQIPHVSHAGRGLQAPGKIPHVSDAGRGLQAPGKIPHVSHAGRGLQAPGKIPHVSDAGRGAQSPPDGELLTPYQGRAREWIAALSVRLARVRIIHGTWTRCLNHHYGKGNTAIFFDPPYVSFERLYGKQRAVALDVAKWCQEHQDEARIVLAGHVGDYDLPGWQVVQWDRGRLTYGGSKTTDQEALWFSPTCRRVK